MYITANVYDRVLRIMLQDGKIGTATAIERGDKTFAITARHVLPEKPGESFRVSNRFHSFDLTATALPGIHEDADIAVFPLPREFARPDLPVDLHSERIVMSQDVLFLGFPFGLALQDQAGLDALAFVKKATVSALQPLGGHRLFFLDGMNNPGFSGGPVLVPHTSGAPQIFAIVASYLEEETEVLGGGPFKSGVVKTNTGIILAHDIAHAITVLDAVAPVA